jgi:hypothetical protein
VEPAAIREAIHQRPFRPFTLRLADGRELFVPHPDFVAVAPNGRRVVVFQGEAMTILEPLLVVSLEYPSPEQTTGPQAGAPPG